uniref:phage holin family protein n=1 Tax=Aerosakkonema funiforme TaxID=1246630 RepID=UPI0038991A03
MNLIAILMAWLVTSVSLFIISKLPLGVEIDGFNKALTSAAVFGILNALLQPVLKVLFFVPNLLTLFLLQWLFLAAINAIIFGLAAWLVEGFRLRWG